MRILLLGGNGQVGHELCRSLEPLGELVVTTRGGTLPDGRACERVDLSEPGAAAALVGRLRPDIVVNATAYTAVDRAEAEPALARRINADVPGEIARACASLGSLFVHYSTDYVFDGTASAPYDEDVATAPLGVYGHTKLAGERAIAASGARHLILRTAWVYGLYGSNFLRTMLRLATEREEVRVVADQSGSPTPAWLIADVTARLLEPERRVPGGVRHLVAGGVTSWHGFAEAIFDEAVQRGLLANKPRLVAIPSSEYPTPARRPAYSALSTARLASELGTALPGWRDALSITFLNDESPIGQRLPDAGSGAFR